MKKKLLSILLVAATLLCFGCGGGSSSATNSGNSGGSANNSSDSKQTGDLYGTKKPVSATYTYENNSYPMTFEFNDDGSYVATLTWGITYVKYYFSRNGLITKMETYDSSMQKDESKYFVNGICPYYEGEYNSSKSHGLEYGAEYLLLEFSISQSFPNYDSDGNILNQSSISERDDTVKQRGSAKDISYGDLTIERDSDGRIIKTSADYTRVAYNNIYSTKYIYSDNSVIILSTYTDNTTSNRFLRGMKVTYNSHGAISEVVKVNENGTESGTKRLYTYDDYGFLTSIKEGASKVVTIEYTY